MWLAEHGGLGTPVFGYQYNRAMAQMRVAGDAAPMKKRILAGLLWFYMIWYAWTIIANFVGVTDLAGPVIGLVAAALIAGDPLGRIWSRPNYGQPAVAPPPASANLA